MEQISMLCDNPFEEKVQKAIERFRAYEDIALSFSPDGFYLAFSGGKDSQCIYHLAVDAGVKFTAHNHHTTVDPPELVQFLRKNYPDVLVEMPKKTMWQLIVDNRMPPSRLARYCCKILKEGGGTGRICVTGVRWAESTARSKRKVLEVVGKSKTGEMYLFNDNEDGRQQFETCTAKGKRVLNPIIDWTDEDVWQYIRSRGIKYCSLYDEGYDRLGCIGCPMARKYGRERDFERWPTYKRGYIRAFEKLAELRNTRGMNEGKRIRFDSGQAIFDWWMSDGKALEEQMEGQEFMDETQSAGE